MDAPANKPAKQYKAKFARHKLPVAVNSQY